MSCFLSRCDSRPWLDVLMRRAGAAVWGCAEAAPVDPAWVDSYDRWIAGGRHGSMDYLEHYGDIRRDPRLLLPGAKTIVAAAFSYDLHPLFSPGALRIAAYALGDDYHDVIRKRLEEVAERFTGLPKGAGVWRVCVDTAPLRERYWAMRAGIGRVGLSGQLIADGAGTACLLGFILTRIPLRADTPHTPGCDGCGRCVSACPGGAIGEDGSFDARRCLSYLSIEYRGDLPAEPSLGNNLYGCDLCQLVCPHNRGVITTPPVAEFTPRPQLLNLTRGAVEAMTQQQFSTLMRRSAIKRAKLAGLKRNAFNV